LDRGEENPIGNVSSNARWSDEDLASEFHMGQQAERPAQKGWWYGLPPPPGPHWRVNSWKS